MPKRDWHLRIFDMQAAAKKIETYVAGMAFVEFSQDDKTLDAGNPPAGHAAKAA